MRRFHFQRDEDLTGVSGTGRVAEGVLFWDGAVVVRWCTDIRSFVFYNSIADAEFIHGHGGSTKIVWEDEA